MTLRGDDAGEANWEPILDDDTFRAVQAIMNNPLRAPQKIGATYPLVGILRCGVCSKALGSTPTRKNGERLRRYGCRAGHGNINADIVEEYVYSIVRPLADHPRTGQIIRDAEGNQDQEAEALRVGIAEANTRLANLADLVADGTLTPDAVRKASMTLRDTIKANESQLAQLAGRSALDNFAGRVAANWDTFDVEDQRAILLSLLECVKLQSSNGKTLQGVGRLNLVWKWEALASIAWESVEPTAEDIAQQEADQRNGWAEVVST